MMSEAQKQDPNVDALIDAAMEEAPQALLAADDVPLLRTDELLAAIQGPALRLVLEARIEQIIKHGHDSESDQMLAITRLPQLAREQGAMAIDVLGHDDRRNIKVAIRRLARSAAINLAAIDRLLLIKEEGTGHVA